MKGGGQIFQDADMEDSGRSKDDDDNENEGPLDNQANGGPDEQILLKSYEEATPILEHYLRQPDDLNKKPDELAMEKCAALINTMRR
ncbi:hypothetical protein QBC37DRAFT_380776 [Rhypophila decipiens]|uniref:Uncharacterized protein n=1 Tax=Rhypophila decipiens TaxID=261697 RepID=A0AAN6XWC3_9PEZI|nr:hypothetical protein QBC37DRAFT_380776 [Rhypophila decipiens]